MAAGSSIALSNGNLYTVAERLNTFEDSHWPYDTGSCTALKMAEAGFYYCGNSTSPDWVRCVVCHHELDGWEEQDIPLEEHKAHSQDCPFINVKDPYGITVGDMLDLEKNASKLFIKKEIDKFRAEAEEYCKGFLNSLREALDRHD